MRILSDVPLAGKTASGSRVTARACHDKYQLRVLSPTATILPRFSFLGLREEPIPGHGCWLALPEWRDRRPGRMLRPRGGPPTSSSSLSYDGRRPARQWQAWLPWFPWYVESLFLRQNALAVEDYVHGLRVR